MSPPAPATPDGDEMAAPVLAGPAPPAAARRASGLAAESRALDVLAAHGLRLLARNWTCPGGELDLVMLDGETLVFVEVRLRKTDTFGSAWASITPTKRRRLAHAARFYLARHRQHAARPVRFDAVACRPDGHGRWRKAVFTMDDVY